MRENGGQAVIKVVRQGGKKGSATVKWETKPGSAHQDTDYRQNSGELIFPADDITPQTIEIDIVDDNKYETNEKFTVTLTALDPENQAEIVGTPATTTVTIIDDDGESESSTVPKILYRIFLLSILVPILGLLILILVFKNHLFNIDISIGIVKPFL